ncbi:hypothetical protein [Xanthomonas maliensis]|uniref:hypothetical protein n=1 Tax=Xanthomonas maliensis TaxID=1321368 RepID=UPI0003A2F415|nr:hypothetical protein [Xanthomonas maliensis]KAB7768797.1 hypothetical protein CKY51_08505 [Xanthomonas maliensis]
MSAIKQHAHTLIAALPDAAGWDDVLRAVSEARLLAAIGEGIDDADRGALASPDRVTAMFAKWGVDVAT